MSINRFFYIIVVLAFILCAVFFLYKFRCEKNLRLSNSEHLDHLNKVYAFLKQKDYLSARAQCQLVKLNSPSDTLQEIVSIECLMDFLEQHEEEFCRKIKDVPSIHFLTGLSFYIEEFYNKAVESWDEMQKNPCNSRLVLAINSFFPESLQLLYQAHSFIEESQFREAHDLLNSKKVDLEAFLRILCSLKEINYLPLEKRSSHYQSITTLFQNLNNAVALEQFLSQQGSPSKMLLPAFLETSYHLICKKIIEEIKSQIIALFLSGANDLQKMGHNLIPFLYQLNAHEAINDVVATLFNHPTCISILKACSKNSLFFETMQEKMMHLLIENIKQKDFNNLLASKELLFSILDETSVTQLIEKEVLKSIELDAASLYDVDSFIHFWEEIALTESKRIEFADSLFSLGAKFWNQEGKEEKGSALFKLSLRVAQQNISLFNKIENFLCRLYYEAENCNLLPRLASIYKAMQHLEIPHRFHLTIAQAANHLADGEYFYCTQNYQHAKECASWVLIFYPQHPQALRLLGLANFHLGNYQIALSTLSRLEIRDDYIQTILDHCFSSKK